MPTAPWQDSLLSRPLLTRRWRFAGVEVGFETGVSPGILFGDLGQQVVPEEPGATVVHHFVHHVVQAVVRRELSEEGPEEGTILAKATQSLVGKGGEQQVSK
jgi:hypothetical protein